MHGLFLISGIYSNCTTAPVCTRFESRRDQVPYACAHNTVTNADGEKRFQLPVLDGFMMQVNIVQGAVTWDACAHNTWFTYSQYSARAYQELVEQSTKSQSNLLPKQICILWMYFLSWMLRFPCWYAFSTQSSRNETMGFYCISQDILK